MSIRNTRKTGLSRRPGIGKVSAAIAVMLAVALALQGCFDPVYPQLDREKRVMEALDADASRDLPPSPLTAAQAVAYALEHSLDAKVAEIESAYQNESLVAARRRLLPSLTARYSPNHTNHPSARWSESTKSGSQSLESSYSSEQTTRQSEVGVVWNLIDFGVGYLRSRQQGERIRHSEQQRRRIRQQVVLDVLAAYWRASASVRIATEAKSLRAELDKQAESVRDSVELRILSGAEGARRELAVYGSLSELELYGRQAAQARLELARVLGCGGTTELSLADFDSAPVLIPEVQQNNPWVLQAAALKRRPELFQQDTQERIAVDEARLALLQMAPNANLSLSFYHDPDKFLEWNDWMTAGIRASWNLLNIPTRMAERRMAKLQKEVAKQKGLALAAAVMAQVGIAFSDWRLGRDYAVTLERRAAARERLVEALAAGEKDGQTRPGEVLQERVRLLSEKAAAIRAEAEVRVAGARLANAIGLDPDDDGNLLWRPEGAPERGGDRVGEDMAEAFLADIEAERVFPATLSGLRVIKAEDFLAQDDSFEMTAVSAATWEEDSPALEIKESQRDEERENAPPAEPVKPADGVQGAAEKEPPQNDEPEKVPSDAADGSAAAPEQPPVKGLRPGKAPARKRKMNQLQTMSPPAVGATPEAGLPKTAFVDNFGGAPGSASSAFVHPDSLPTEAISPGMTVYDSPPPGTSSAMSLPRGSAAPPYIEPLEPLSGPGPGTSSAGSLPFAVARVDEELTRRGTERAKALEPLQELPRTKGIRPPVTEVRIPSLKPPGR